MTGQEIKEIIQELKEKKVSYFKSADFEVQFYADFQEEKAQSLKENPLTDPIIRAFMKQEDLKD